ncbi:hypothetical protein EEL51_07790 [Muribaculaceae bacterium Isolate-110 (HZI)]|nr:hypothetical protein EEL51_07790 [Muribaculaceae bacterium Isolate-110 (HZI)]
MKKWVTGLVRPIPIFQSIVIIMVMVLVVFFWLVFLMFFMLFRFRAMMMVTVGKIIFMFHAPMAVDGATRGERDGHREDRAYRQQESCKFPSSHK